MNDKIREIIQNFGLTENQINYLNETNDLTAFVYNCIDNAKYNQLTELSLAGFDFRENYNDFLYYCLHTQSAINPSETLKMFNFLVSLGCDVKKSHEEYNLFRYIFHCSSSAQPDDVHYNIFKFLVVEHGLDPTTGNYNIFSNNKLDHGISSDNLLKRMRELWTEHEAPLPDVKVAE